MTQFSCANAACKYQFNHSEDHKQPCPKCGELARLAYLSSGLSGGGGVSHAEWTALSTNTARAVRGTKLFAAVDQWSRLLPSDIGAHTLNRCLKEELAHLSTYVHDGAPFYRGRFLSVAPKCPDDVGPPKSDKSREGRYNQAKTSALYLCSSTSGVRLELHEAPPGEICYVQEFHISAGTSEIADLRPTDPSSLVTAVMFKAEDCCVPGRQPESYAFSQHIARVLAGRFSGMITPGVRGDGSAPYSNLVFFNAFAVNWRQWIEAAGFCPQPQAVRVIS